MTEPKRWLDEGAPQDVERLVRAAQAERPDSASLGRSLAAVGVGVAVTQVAATAKAAGTAAGVGATTKVTTPLVAGVFAKWVAIGTLGGTLAVGIAEVTTEATRQVVPSPSTRASAPVPPSRVQATSSPVRPALSAPPEELAPALVPDFAAAPEPSTLMATPNSSEPANSNSDPRAHLPTSSAAPYSSPIDADTLAAEVKSIDRARSALAASKAAEALAVLDDYERLFRNRGFAPEALYLRMEAYASLGRTAEAHDAAERLLKRYPNSLHTARARAVLSKNP